MKNFLMTTLLLVATVSPSFALHHGVIYGAASDVAVASRVTARGVKKLPAVPKAVGKATIKVVKAGIQL